MELVAPGATPRFALLTTIAVAIGIAISVYAAVGTPGNPGVAPASGAAMPAHVGWLAPDGPAWSAGVRPGDVILRLVQATGDTPADLVVQAGSGQLRIGSAAMRPTALDLLLAALGYGFLALGTAVLLKSSDPPAARAFWRASLFAGSALGFVPAGIHGVPWALVLDFAALRLLGPALLDVALLLPAPGIHPRRPPLIWAPALVLLLLYAICWWRPAPLFSLMRIGDDVTLGGYVLAASLHLVLSLRHPPSAALRAQLQFLALGLIGGFLPFLLLTLLPLILSGRALVPAQLSILALILLPLCVGAAIGRTEFLGIPSLMRRRTLHLLLHIILLAGVAAAAGLFVVAGPQRWGWPAPAAAAAASVLTVLGCLALWPSLRRRAERAVLHDAYDLGDTLLQISDQLAQAAPQASGPSIAMHLITVLDARLVLLRTVRDQWTYLHPHEPVPAPLLGAVDTRAQILLGAQLAAVAMLEHIHGMPILFLQLREDQQTLAMLCLGPKRSGDRYTDQDRVLLGILGRQLADGFQREQLREQLEEHRPRPGQPRLGPDQIGADTVGEYVCLTAREFVVLSYMAEGLANKEIAQRLNRDIRTVEKHVTHILRKLGTRTRVEAVLIARRKQMLPPS